jgi:RNA polymerase sigma factor (sigma-70 family)
LNIVSYCETQGEERLRCAQAGCEDCLSALLRENRNLILAVIRVQYMGQADDADLEQEGWIGFWQAVKWYDPQRGARFSTFAWLVIRQRIWRAVARASSVERWEESDGPYSEAADAQVITNWQAAQIHEALEEGMSELSEREHQVMLLHYGWAGRPPQTFAEISETLGLTRQRMHQIHNEALLLLRVPALSIRLRSICQRGSRSDYRQSLRQNQEWQHKYRRRG